MRVAAAALTFVLLAPTAPGAAQKPWSDWGQGSAKWLMTDGERESWDALETPEEAASFVDRFWARRDPSPETPVNELREVIRRREADADHRFSYGKRLGSLTDRGRVLILLGAPSSIAVVPSDGRRPGTELWFWEGDRRPISAPEGEESVNVSFIEQSGTGELKISSLDRDRVEQLLERAKIDMIERPGQLLQLRAPQSLPGTEVKVEIVDLEPPRTEFEDPDLRASWESFDEADAYPPIHLTWGEFITAAGQYYVAMQLYVPASSGLVTGSSPVLFGALTDPEGRIAAVFEEPARLMVTGTDAYLDRTLALTPGEYVATVGLASNGQVLGMIRDTVVLEPLSPAEPRISRLYLSDNVMPLIERGPLTAPFTFGSLKVVPKGNRRFEPGTPIWYAIELRNPAVGELGVPSVNLELLVEGKTIDGVPVKMRTPPMTTNAQAIRDQPGRWLVGGSLARGALELGQYRLEVRVTDAIADRNWSTETIFEVVAD